MDIDRDSMPVNSEHAPGSVHTTFGVYDDKIYIAWILIAKQTFKEYQKCSCSDWKNYKLYLDILFTEHILIPKLSGLSPSSKTDKWL